MAEADDVGCFHSRRLESTQVPVWTVALQSTTELHRLNLAISSPSVILSEPFLPRSKVQPNTLTSAYLCETFPCQNKFCSGWYKLGPDVLSDAACAEMGYFFLPRIIRFLLARKSICIKFWLVYHNGVSLSLCNQHFTLGGNSDSSKGSVLVKTDFMPMVLECLGHSQW